MTVHSLSTAAEPARPEATRSPAEGLTAVWPATRWRGAQGRHHVTVDELTAARRSRQAANLSHPVEDFLFTYYRLKPAQLRQWHPGASVALADAGELGRRRFYRTDAEGTGRVDVAGFVAERTDSVRLITTLLPSTAAAVPQFGCFGLHEWAMVHRSGADRRHPDWPLRLGAGGTDAVVDNHPLRCTHFDAFRFFTPSAQPLNLVQPSVTSRTELEQPACLHANMDLYKWAYKMLPVVSSELVLDCFRLARDVRELDMRASPYDFSSLGYVPVAIETAEGKAEYVAAQRLFATRAAALRGRLMGALAPAVDLLT